MHISNNSSMSAVRAKLIKDLRFMYTTAMYF
jgi:hypothetical protein